MGKERDTLYIEGKKDLPLLIFIHGLGTNQKIWTDPEDVKILIGKYPLSSILNAPPSIIEKPPIISFGQRPKSLKTTFHDLKDEGFPMLLYTQRRSAAGASVLVSELTEILNSVKGIKKRPIIFICHSRGGLIARKTLESLKLNCIGLVTIATPHRGSRMASIAENLSLLLPVLEPFARKVNHENSKRIIERVKTILKGRAIKELLPESGFIKGLDNSILKRIKTISIGGNDPTLIRIYRYNRQSKRYRVILKIPNVLSSILPERIVPDEIKEGKGDSLVTAESSEAPHAVAHYNFRLNHAALVFDSSVKERIKAFIGEIA